MVVFGSWVLYVLIQKSQISFQTIHCYRVFCTFLERSGFFLGTCFFSLLLKIQSFFLLSLAFIFFCESIPIWFLIHSFLFLIEKYQMSFLKNTSSKFYSYTMIFYHIDIQVSIVKWLAYLTSTQEAGVRFPMVPGLYNFLFISSKKTKLSGQKSPPSHGRNREIF